MDVPQGNGQLPSYLMDVFSIQAMVTIMSKSQMLPVLPDCREECSGVLFIWLRGD